MPHKISLKNLILILINGALLLAIIIITIISSSRSAILTILTVPSDATITINNQEFLSGTYKFFPGEITAKITKDGFDTKEISLALEANANNRLFVYLTKDGELSYIQDNSTDFETLRQISNISDDEYLNSFVKKYDDEQALKNFLPIYYEDMENLQFFSIFYETEKCTEHSYCLLISDVIEGNRTFATNLLKKYGYSSPEYEIIYEYNCEKGDLECANL